MAIPAQLSLEWRLERMVIILESDNVIANYLMRVCSQRKEVLVAVWKVWVMCVCVHPPLSSNTHRTTPAAINYADKL